MSFDLKSLKITIGKNVFIAKNTILTGEVKIGDNSGIWFNVVIRGDVDTISIGNVTNVQDLTMLHVTKGFPQVIGDYVTIGHSCILHGCTIGNNCLIGMGTTVCDGAKIGNNCIVGANSLVTQGKVFADNSMIMGSPAKVVRSLSDEEISKIRKSAENYMEYAAEYLNLLTSKTQI